MRLLIVDGDVRQLEAARELLAASGHEVRVATDAVQAEGLLSEHAPDAILLDLALPGAVPARMLLQRIHEKYPELAVIAIGEKIRESDVLFALGHGASDFVAKPFDRGELSFRIARIAPGGTATASREPRESRRPAATALVGRSRVMQLVETHLDRFAATDAPVLITGESGTGKEVAAHAIHSRSARAQMPFVPVNCAAFPESLLEAELFGHERGAFTGAVRRRHGRFKSADGGTLFLDEVGEIPLPAQAKLLRVLEQGSFEPLGTNESVHVNVRVLSATHRNLKQLVEAGRFREDLVYRLKILELELPPLRERRGDLKLLAAHFLSLFATPGSAQRLSPRALSALEAYPFPGNVRELEHAIRHAVALSAGEDEIDLPHLPSDIGGGMMPTAVHEQVVTDKEHGFRTLQSAVREFERDYVSQALAAARGKKVRAAELLGISRKNLWQKLRRYGIEDAPAPETDEPEAAPAPAPGGPDAIPPGPRRPA